MATQALIELTHPDSSSRNILRFRVHYDGGSALRDEMQTLIARDGYDTVYATFAGQQSRFWAGLVSDLYVMPDYVESYPANWTFSLVEGYGLLLTGPEEIQQSSNPECFDPDTWWSIFWRVSARGGLSGGFAGFR